MQAIFSSEFTVRDPKYKGQDGHPAMEAPGYPAPPGGDYHIRNCQAYCYDNGCYSHWRDRQFRCNCWNCPNIGPQVVS